MKAFAALAALGGLAPLTEAGVYYDSYRIFGGVPAIKYQWGTFIIYDYTIDSNGDPLQEMDVVNEGAMTHVEYTFDKAPGLIKVLSYRPTNRRLEVIIKLISPQGFQQSQSVDFERDRSG